MFVRQSFVTIAWKKKSKYLQWCLDSIGRWAALNIERDIVLFSIDISSMRNSRKSSMFLKFDALAASMKIMIKEALYVLYCKAYHAFLKILKRKKRERQDN